MSWIFAVSKDQHHDLPASELKKMHGKPFFVINSPSMYLAVGGLLETCLYEVHEKEESGWAVVGLGIKVTAGESRFLTSDDWKRFLSGENYWQHSLDGHFAVIRWTKKQIECFVDQLGLRTLFFGKCADGICISTRLDWVARFTGRNEVDFSSLEGKWLMFNQLEYRSCVVGIDRLGPMGRLLIKDAEVVKCNSVPWLPDFENNEIDPAVGALEVLVRCAVESGQPVSLGLSGGLDSRLLLAIFTTMREQRFFVHTFGDPLDPDVEMSAAICEQLKLERLHFEEGLPDVDSTLSMLNSYIAQTCLVEPASSVTKLRYYPELHYKNRMMIDGGFGEIARRQYLNRLALLGRSALRSRDLPRLLPLMRVSRADVFTPEVHSIIVRGAIASLERTLDLLPPISNIGIENFVDLLAVRTRVPNYGSPEQARLDGEVKNFMPLVQPSFLRAVFATKVKLRSSARFYRDLIRSRSALLGRLPLVKSGVTYPFGLSAPAAWLFTRVKTKLRKRFVDPSPDRFLFHIREFVLDIAHSNEVTSYPAYNGLKVQESVNDYYKGTKVLRPVVDWWLTFELWRRSLLK